MSEKSGSMSRTSRICFIDSEYEDKLENRIMLDINLNNVILSKYLAYRGLMLSSGMRMDNNDFVLDDPELSLLMMYIVNHVRLLM